MLVRDKRTHACVCHDLHILLCSAISKKELLTVADPPRPPLFLDCPPLSQGLYLALI